MKRTEEQARDLNIRTAWNGGADGQKQAPRKPGLGRGLDALFSSNTKSHDSIAHQNNSIGQGQNSIPQQSQTNASEAPRVLNIVVSVPIEEIIPNKDQPRKQFNQEKLEELAMSIGEHGLLQPILLQKTSSGLYQIVAGERRFRASQIAGLKEVQAMVVPIESERKLLELALLENIQRTDLSVVEEARAYASLVEDFRCTHETISKSLGKSRSHITNCLRILKMPDFVLNLLEAQDITFGHAKVLASLEDPSFWAQMIVEKGLTVRMLESAILLEKESQAALQRASQQNDLYNKETSPKQQGAQKEPLHTIEDKQLRAATAKFNQYFSHLGETNITEEKDGTVYIITHCKNKMAALRMLNSHNLSTSTTEIDAERHEGGTGSL